MHGAARTGAEVAVLGMTAAPTHFASAAAFRRWLRTHHATTDHLVVRIAKAHALSSGIGYAEALDEALCVGWIDGVRRSLDADAYAIRFTPRRARSIWSLVNVAHVERLQAAGRMQPAGLAAFEARTPERTGIYSFERAASELSADDLATFRRERRAWAYFQAAAPSYRRTSTHWVVTAKRAQTRAKRLAELIACCDRQERIPSLRPTPRPKH